MYTFLLCMHGDTTPMNVDIINKSLHACYLEDMMVGFYDVCGSKSTPWKAVSNAFSHTHQNNIAKIWLSLPTHDKSIRDEELPQLGQDQSFVIIITQTKLQINKNSLHYNSDLFIIHILLVGMYHIDSMFTISRYLY